jgi:hypothetical protein
MKTVNFKSPLANEMAHFVKLKQLSGVDFQNKWTNIFSLNETM